MTDAIDERWSLQFSNTPPSVTIWAAAPGREPRNKSIAHVELASRKGAREAAGEAFRAIVAHHNLLMDAKARAAYVAFPPLADVGLSVDPDNSDYMRLVIMPNEGERKVYRLSLGAADQLQAEISGWRTKAADSEPIPMILTCPGCNVRHIDQGDFATKPHHTHACQGCGLVWRPAKVATVGVRFLPGFKDIDPTAT